MKKKLIYVSRESILSSTRNVLYLVYERNVKRKKLQKDKSLYYAINNTAFSSSAQYYKIVEISVGTAAIGLLRDGIIGSR